MNENACVISGESVDLFRQLVLEGLTLTAIRREMSPVLEGRDDIYLIREMLRILKGE